MVLVLGVLFLLAMVAYLNLTYNWGIETHLLYL